MKLFLDLYVVPKQLEECLSLQSQDKMTNQVQFVVVLERKCFEILSKKGVWGMSLSEAAEVHLSRAIIRVELLREAGMESSFDKGIHIALWAKLEGYSEQNVEPFLDRNEKINKGGKE